MRFDALLPRRLVRPLRPSVRGFTLVEVLVAVLVLCLGVLGAAGMQVSALRANREARAQEIGTRLALELSDLIRANHLLAAQTTADANPYLISFSGTPTSNAATCFVASACTASKDIAKRDVDDWASRAASLLPGLVVSVCFDSSAFDNAGLPKWACDNTGSTLQIKIGWTRASLDSSSNSLDRASTPAVVLPVTPRGA